MNVDVQQLAFDRDGGDQPPGRPRGRHLLTRYLLPLTLLVGFLGLLAWAGRDLLFPPPEVTVVPVLATSRPVQQAGTPLFQAAGWMEPRPTPVRVPALAPGVVDQLLVIEDQPVKAGQPIAELVKDDAELAVRRAMARFELCQAERAQAQAALAAAETRWRQPVHLDRAVSEAEAAWARVETERKKLPFAIRQAEAEWAALRKAYEGKLAATGVVAGVAVEVAHSRLAAAQARVEQLRAEAKALDQEHAALLRRRDAVRTERQLLAEETRAKAEAEAVVRAKTAGLEQARVDVEAAGLQLQRMTVRAPIDGRVYHLVAHPGTQVGSGGTQLADQDSSTIVTLYRPDQLQVRVDVRFEDLPQVQLNQPVTIDNPALASPLQGHVLFVSSEADIQKNTLEVKVAIADPPLLLKPEMLVEVTFLSIGTRAAPAGVAAQADTSRRIFVPAGLVQQEADRSYVWRADRSTLTAHRQPVRLGKATGDGLVEVLDGLNISSRIIATGREALSDGCRIRITGEDPPALSEGPAPAAPTEP